MHLDTRSDGYAGSWMGGARSGSAATLDGPAHQLEHLAGYRRVGPVHQPGVALGEAVHQPLLLPDVLERADLAPPAVDGRTLPPLLGARLHGSQSSASKPSS